MLNYQRVKRGSGTIPCGFWLATVASTRAPATRPRGYWMLLIAEKTTVSPWCLPLILLNMLCLESDTFCWTCFVWNLIHRSLFIYVYIYVYLSRIEKDEINIDKQFSTISNFEVIFTSACAVVRQWTLWSFRGQLRAPEGGSLQRWPLGIVNAGDGDTMGWKIRWIHTYYIYLYHLIPGLKRWDQIPQFLCGIPFVSAVSSSHVASRSDGTGNPRRIHSVLRRSGNHSYLE